MSNSQPIKSPFLKRSSYVITWRCVGWKTTARGLNRSVLWCTPTWLQPMVCQWPRVLGICSHKVNRTAEPTGSEKTREWDFMFSTVIFHSRSWQSFFRSGKAAPLCMKPNRTQTFRKAQTGTCFDDSGFEVPEQGVSLQLVWHLVRSPSLLFLSQWYLTNLDVFLVRFLQVQAKQQRSWQAQSNWRISCSLLLVTVTIAVSCLMLLSHSKQVRVV